MANTLELTDKKNQLEVRANAIINHAQQESRKLRDDELAEFNQITDEIRSTESEIREITKKLNNHETRKNTMEKFSLIKAINDIANNRNLDERSQMVVNQGVAEMRKAGQSYSGQIVLPVEERSTIQATVATHGEEVVAEDKLNILEPLRDALVMTKAGAVYMTGLVGNVSIPTYNGANVGWQGEIDPATDGGGTFGEVLLSPKRLTAYLDVSKQFLIQDSASAEALLKNDIVKALSNKLEATILGDGAGSANEPEGIFSNSAATYTKDYNGTVDMEEALEAANVTGNYTYIINPADKATLRKAKTDAGSGQFVYSDGEINGIPALVTNACLGIVVGDFSNYVIAQWGGIDLTVDPYTQARNGKIRLVINAYFDAKPTRADAFITTL